MDAQKKAYISAFAYACTIGFSFLCVKICLEYTSPVNILAHRFLIAGFVAIAVLLVRRVKLDLGSRDIGSILLLALFYPLSFFLLQTFGLVYIQTVEAGIIQAIAPVFTLALAFIILRERTTFRQILFVLVSVGGVVFIFIMNGADITAYNPLGVVLILGATISMALYVVFTRKLTKRYAVFTLTFVMSITGCVVFTGIAVAQGLAQGSIQDFLVPFSNFPYVLAIVFLGVASSFLSSFFSNYALSKLQASKMSVFTNLSTVIAIFAGVVFLHEDFFWFHVVGTIAVIVGVLGVNSKQRKAD